MKRYPSRFLGFSAAVALCLAGAPIHATPADDLIPSSFENTYAYKTYLKEEAIKTEAKDGVVTLTGTVAVDSHRALAQETVGNLPGVTRVDNRLQTEAEVAAAKADYWIEKKVKLNLLFHRHVNAGKTAVEVKGGVVTLKGEAASSAQKDLTAEYAKDIDGVTVVVNEMTVAATPEPAERTAGEKIDDASIAAQVKTALLSHRSTSAFDTKVSARDGEVTLTGIARNAAEVTLVTKLVADIQGVTGVKNQMTVEEPKTK